MADKAQTTIAEQSAEKRTDRSDVLKRLNKRLETMYVRKWKHIASGGRSVFKSDAPNGIPYTIQGSQWNAEQEAFFNRLRAQWYIENSRSLRPIRNSFGRLEWEPRAEIAMRFGPGPNLGERILRRQFDQVRDKEGNVIYEFPLPSEVEMIAEDADQPDRLDYNLPVTPSPVQGISVQSVAEFLQGVIDYMLLPAEFDKLPWIARLQSPGIADSISMEVRGTEFNSKGYPDIIEDTPPPPRAPREVDRVLPKGFDSLRQELANLFAKILAGQVSDVEDLVTIVRNNATFGSFKFNQLVKQVRSTRGDPKRNPPSGVGEKSPTSPSAAKNNPNPVQK